MSELQVEGLIPDDRLEFLWKQHAYISDFIKFADTKAGFTASLATVLIGALLSSNSKFRGFLPRDLANFTTYAQAFSVVSIALLFFAITIAAWSILPKLLTGKNPCPISWVDIAKYDDAESFRAVNRTLSKGTACDLMAAQVYYMARVCKRKHKMVAISLVSAFAGGMIALLLVII